MYNIVNFELLDSYSTWNEQIREQYFNSRQKKKKKNIVKRNNRRISPKNLTKLSISKLIGFQFGVENKI